MLDGSCKQTLGSLADKAAKKQKRIAYEQSLVLVTIEGQAIIENVYSFEYLGSRMQYDGDDKAEFL